MVTTFSGILRVPVVDRSVGSARSVRLVLYHYSDMAGSISLSAAAGLPGQVLSHGGLQSQ